MVVNGIVFGVKTPIMCLPVPRPPVQSGASVCPSETAQRTKKKKKIIILSIKNIIDNVY